MTWEFQESIEKEVGFPGVFKSRNTHVQFPWCGSWFLTLISTGWHAHRISWGESLCFSKAKGKVTNLKNPGAIFRKVHLQPPPLLVDVWIFSGIAHFMFHVCCLVQVTPRVQVTATEHIAMVKNNGSNSHVVYFDMIS